MSMRFETQLLTCSGDDSDDSGGSSDDQRKESMTQWNLLVSTTKKDAAKSRAWWRRWLPWWMKDAKFRQDEAAKKLNIVLQLDGSRKDLHPGQLISVMQVYREYIDKLAVGMSNQTRGLRMDVIAGVCSVAVPVLIPYAQEYKEDTLPFKVIPGKETNIGTCIAILAVICSLVATILTAFQKTSKTKEISTAQLQEAESTEKELTLFISRSGNEYDDDYDFNASRHDAYNKFVINYKKIREKAFDDMQVIVAKKGDKKQKAKALVTNEDTTEDPPAEDQGDDSE